MIRKTEIAVYLHLMPASPLPEIETGTSFKAIIIAELPTTAKWRFEVGTWLIKHGCRFTMAWGEDCSAWDDDIDWANLDLWSFEEIPDKHFVMTSWHENETLEEVFHDAPMYTHPVCDVSRLLLLHVATTENREAILARYASAVTVE